MKHKLYNSDKSAPVVSEDPKQVILKHIEKCTDGRVVSRIKRKLSYFHKQMYIKYLIRNKGVKKLKTRIVTGQELSIVLPDNISASLYLSGYFEDQETKGFIELIKADTTFIDIGAHIGYYSILSDYVGGPDTKIISIEPTPFTFELLAENTKRLHQGIQLNMALHSKPGKMEINDYGIRYMSFNSFEDARLNIKIQGKKISVRVETMDNIVMEFGLKPDLVKIDAESAEIEILKGGHETLLNYKPTLFIEVGDFENIGVGSSLKIIDFLSAYGYLPYEYKNDFVPHIKHNGAYPSMSLFFFHEERIK